MHEPIAIPGHLDQGRAAPVVQDAFCLQRDRDLLVLLPNTYKATRLHWSRRRVSAVCRVSAMLAVWHKRGRR